MPQPLVTIVVAPRERFSVSQRSLEAIYANTAPPFELVYVDGGSPSRIARYRADQSQARGFTLVRTPHHLVPNAARNLGLRHVRTRQRPDEVQAHRVRQPCEHVEFDCMLVRTEVFERPGPLDEEFKSVAEHTDLCLLVRREGGAVYFEPESAATYITSGGFTAADYACFARRWSRAWTESSLEHFRAKWDLPPGEAGLASIARWAEEHRYIPLRPVLRALERGLGWKCGSWVGRQLLGVERQLNRWWEPRAGGVPAAPAGERAKV